MQFVEDVPKLKPVKRVMHKLVEKLDVEDTYDMINTCCEHSRLLMLI